MKKLVVSGCSWGDLDFFSQFHPDMDCSWPKWPNILAEKMNLEPVNLCNIGFIVGIITPLINVFANSLTFCPIIKPRANPRMYKVE